MNGLMPRYSRKRSPIAVRGLGWLAVASMLALALLGPSAGGVAAATPSDNSTSNLQGRASDYSNVLIDGAPGTQADTILFCSSNNAVQFVSHIHFDLTGATTPAGSYFRVYLTPNGGAQLSPVGVDVTQNQGTVDVSGLSAGHYDLAITLNVTTAFSITSGGVLLVIAD